MIAEQTRAQIAETLRERMETAKRLSTLGSGDRIGGAERSLPTRLGSRVRSTLGLLFTARQKRFNIEVVGALEQAWQIIGDLSTDVAQLEYRIATVTADIEPPHFRAGTLDQSIWIDVNRNNEYELPDDFGPTDTIIDIGAHIGSFSFACLRRGAGYVASCEPNPANAALAKLNLARFGPRAVVHQHAVWRSDQAVGNLPYLASSDPHNTGGGGVITENTLSSVETIQLDGLIQRTIQASGSPRIRLLKIDCEGSEYPILMTSRQLHLVDTICGEYHESGHPIPDHARVPGVEKFDRYTLCQYLTTQGYTVEHKQHTTNPDIGLFFARRNSHSR